MKTRNQRKRPNDGEIEVLARPLKKPVHGKHTRNKRDPQRSPTPQEDDISRLSHISLTPEPTPIELQQRISDMECQIASLGDGVNRKFRQQGQQLERILRLLDDNHIHPQEHDTPDQGDEQDPDDCTLRGNTLLPPLDFVKKAYPWVKESLIHDIIGMKLETKDLPKLINPRYRPKSRVATNNTTGTAVLFDTASNMPTILEPDTPTYEKDIPDMKALLAIVNTYAGIRGAWDHVLNIQMGPALNGYATLLINLERFERFTFKGILAYFLDHFETYQMSTNPKDWFLIDQHLHSLHMRPPPEIPVRAAHSPLAPPSPTKRHGSPSKHQGNPSDICRNYNDPGKGCKYPNCLRRHICVLCANDTQTQPVFKCNMHTGISN